MNMKDNILFVDDETFSLRMIKRVFLDKPYNLFFATNGKEALEILSKQEIKVVITDLEMPELNGAVLVELIQKTYPNIVKIILSGNKDKQDSLSIFNNANIFKYFVKPIDFNNELFLTLDEAILLYEENLQKESNLLKEKILLNSVKHLPEALILSLLKEAIDNINLISEVISELPFMEKELSKKSTLDIQNRNEKISKNLNNLNDILTDYFKS